MGSVSCEANNCFTAAHCEVAGACLRAAKPSDLPRGPGDIALALLVARRILRDKAGDLRKVRDVRKCDRIEGVSMLAGCPTWELGKTKSGPYCEACLRRVAAATEVEHLNGMSNEIERRIEALSRGIPADVPDWMDAEEQKAVRGIRLVR